MSRPESGRPAGVGSGGRPPGGGSGWPAPLAGLPVAALIGVLVAMLTVGWGAAPASAHTGGGGLPDAPYYRSTVLQVEPAVAGLTVALDQAGETVTLTNGTGRTVEVPGYSGEDYLRFTTTDVEENANSLSAFLNGSLVIAGLPQQTSSSTAPPAWHQVSATPSYSWHDHRMHWMAQQRPPMVAADPGQPHTVFDWVMPLRVGGQPVTVTGRLTWTGEPAFSGLTGSLYVIVATLVLGIVALLGLRLRLRWKRPAPLPSS